MDVQQIISRADEMEHAGAFLHVTDELHPDDAYHRTFRNIGLKEDAELHRFTNRDLDGKEVKRSAIWKDGVEYAWHYADKEKDMIEWWQRRGYLLTQ